MSSFPNTKPEICITANEACRRLGVKRVTLWKLIKQGRIVPTRYGSSRVMVRESEIERFIANCSKPLDHKSAAVLSPQPPASGNDNVIKGRRKKAAA